VDFEVSEVELPSSKVIAGDSFTIRVTVSNTGEAEGTFDGTLTLDGERVAGQGAELPVGESTTLTFTQQIDEQATVDVGLNGDHLGEVTVVTRDDYWSFEAGGPVYSSPTVVDGTVYVGSHDRNLYAIDAETGEEQWRFRTGKNPNLHGKMGMKGVGIRSSPQVVDGTVYFGANDYNVYAVDAATGEEEWRVETESYIYSSPTLVDGIVYVASRGSTLYALDADTGDSIWEADAGISGTAPLVVDGKVIVGSYTLDRTVSCYDANTGEVLWQREQGTETCSSPTYHQGKILLGSLDKNVYALDPETGDIDWKTDVGSTQNNASFTAKDGTVYATRYGGGMVALDVATGDKLWEAQTFSAGNQAPTIVGDTVALVHQAGGLSFVDAETGDVTFAHEFHTPEGGNGMVGSSIVVDGVLFVGTDSDHTLHALETGLDGSSDGSRVMQGMKNHHHAWAGTDDPNLEMQDTGHHVTDNIENIRVTPDEESEPDPPYDGYLAHADNYEGTVDYRGRDEVRIEVGVGRFGYSFGPPAILIDTGTTVVWEWTGEGGAHNVTAENGNFVSDLMSDEGATFTRTFEEERIHKYFCEPHRSAGMKGVIAVGDTEEEIIRPDE